MPDTPPCLASMGGYSQVVIFANHNGKPMFNYMGHLDTVYVKFNTLKFPGKGIKRYDTFFVSLFMMHDHVHCTGLHCGDYYFYRTAYDSAKNVTYYGGAGISVNAAVKETDTTFNVYDN